MRVPLKALDGILLGWECVIAPARYLPCRYGTGQPLCKRPVSALGGTELIQRGTKPVDPVEIHHPAWDSSRSAALGAEGADRRRQRIGGHRFGA
jgi:hypothetical protein